MLRKMIICGLGMLMVISTTLAGGNDSLSPIQAIPAPDTVKIDGKLDEWNMTASQVIYVSKEFYEHERTEYAFFYDSHALYFVGKVWDRSPLANVHDPTERFWEGDSVQLRLYTKLNSQHIPGHQRGVKSQDKQVVHANFYQQDRKKNWLVFNYSIDFIETKMDPEGSEVAFQVWPDQQGYSVEVKMPWSLLNVPEVPKPGDTIRTLIEYNISNASGNKRIRRSLGGYKKHPGDFGFKGGNAWGFLEFLAQAPAKRSWPSAEALAASFSKIKGLPIPIEFPQKACATLNIRNAEGEVVRELVLDREQPPGPYTFVWDGKDRFGKAAPLGEYKYKVLFYPTIKADYLGSVGSSGQPPYWTPDGRGAWGGDHSNPLAVSSDATGKTFLWPIAEMAKAIIRLDHNDKLQWRHTPFFDAAGNFWTLASDGDYVYFTYETPEHTPSIVRLSAKDGQQAFFQPMQKGIELPVADSQRIEVEKERRATPFNLIASGLAVDGKYLYVAIYPQNEVLVLNKTNAELVKTFSVPFPRGLAVGKAGDLFAISAPPEAGGAIYRIFPNGKSTLVTDKNLTAPWNIACAADGTLVVSDLGDAQQVKEFSPTGKLLRSHGRKGGRAASGKVVKGDYLNPAGVAVEPDGDRLIAECSIPSTISRLGKDGKVLKQWFGTGRYANQVWPDATDPFTVYNALPGGVLRSKLHPQDKSWMPQAYWSFTNSRAKKKGNKHGMSFDYFKGPYFQNFLGLISYPQSCVFKGHQYLSTDSAEHPIVRVEGDELIPIAAFFVKNGKICLAHDRNDNGVIDDNEIEVLEQLPAITNKRDIDKGYLLLDQRTGSHTFSPHSGNWFIAGMKRIYKIPLRSAKDGRLVFDGKNAQVFIDDITDGKVEHLWNSWRQGVLGMREDSKGNLYVVYTIPGRSAGIGHSSDIKEVNLVKYDKSGKRLWSVGTKASSFAKPGEIYNPWIMAGLIDDRLIGISDEAGGTIHFYDTDGFYRGAVFNDVARGDSLPGPYLFGGENFSGRIQYFPERGEAFAYQGHDDSRVFRLTGWNGKTSKRSGSLKLVKHYGDSNQTGSGKTAIAKVDALPTDLNAVGFWKKITPITIRKGEQKLGKVQIAVDATDLAFRFDVTDRTPLKNSSNSAKLAFKGGDAVDLYFGPAEKRKRRKPVAGDIRIMVAPIKGKLQMLAMRPVSNSKQPERYVNPGGYVKSFDYVGAIPGATVKGSKTATGYRITGRIPLAFLAPLQFTNGSALAFDADILESDPAGQKTTTRNFWHASGDSTLTMTQDIPTECWLYPNYWGTAIVTDNAKGD